MERRERTDPFDPAAFDVAYKAWLTQPPMTRLGLKSPGEIIDGIAGTLAGAWGVTAAAARPYATRLFSKGKAATAQTVAANAIPKVTWDALEAQLTLDEVIAAVEHPSMTTAAAVQALVTRLNQSALNGANLTAIALGGAPTATLHRGRFFPYHGTIETEVSVTWNDGLYMPPGRHHWGEVHIHYTGTVVDPAWHL